MKLFKHLITTLVIYLVTPSAIERWFPSRFLDLRNQWPAQWLPVGKRLSSLTVRPLTDFIWTAIGYLTSSTLVPYNNEAWTYLTGLFVQQPTIVHSKSCDLLLTNYENFLFTTYDRAFCSPMRLFFIQTYSPWRLIKARSTEKNFLNFNSQWIWLNAARWGPSQHFLLILLL